jgi:hypothetical protein
MTRVVLKASGVRSLVWSGDRLVDWVGGGGSFGLDGSWAESRVRYAYEFDAACSCEDYAIIYTRLATKGLIVRLGEWGREINRSYYQANVYDYPVCLWRHGGRILLAHCPDHYNQIEIEDAVTGERLTAAAGRKPSDFFHSRLQPSPDGRRLLSAGWVWHPLDAIRILDVDTALKDPHHLDRDDQADARPACFEDASACWQTNTRVLVCGQGEIDLDEAGPPHLFVLDDDSRSVVSKVRLERPGGAMMPVGEDAVVMFYEHPRLVSIADGKTLQEWPDLKTGKRISSIDMDGPSPIMALDPANRRFAVAQDDAIHVVTPDA